MKTYDEIKPWQVWFFRTLLVILGPFVVLFWILVELLKGFKSAFVFAYLEARILVSEAAEMWKSAPEALAKAKKRREEKANGKAS